jgi:hypothetical protein
MRCTRKIIVYFPVPVEFPPGFQQALDGLINMVTEAYERDHPTRTMWPSGCGSMPLNPDCTQYDDSVYMIDVTEREANARELERRLGGGTDPLDEKVPGDCKS